jgi:hypothetical protein
VHRRVTSVALPRASTARILRLRAEEKLFRFEQLRTGLRGLVVPSREAVIAGERVHVEIGFGALADEIVFDAEVVEARLRDGQAPEVVLSIAVEDEPRVRYVEAVMAGQRPAAARRHARIPVDLPVRWSWGFSTHDSRIVDLSPGGAFVSSHDMPAVGAVVELELAGQVRVSGAVAWSSRTLDRAGFGVQFRFTSREEASRVGDLLRTSSAYAAAV